LNPRDPFEPNGFQDRRFQPLTHSSVSKYNLQQLLAGHLVTIFESIAERIVTKLSPKLSSFATAAFFESRFVCVRVCHVTPSIPAFRQAKAKPVLRSTNGFPVS
jgi:hypothetical protein